MDYAENEWEVAGTNRIKMLSNLEISFCPIFNSEMLPGSELRHIYIKMSQV